MKRTGMGVSILLLLCPLAVFAHNDPVPPLDSYYTGSKIFTSDSVCSVCHAAGNPAVGNVKLAFNGVAATTYTPGTTIPIQVTVTDTGGGRTVWGFELAVRFTNAKPAGTLTAVNSNTRVSTLQFPAPQNPVITHNGAVQAIASSFTFTANWTAPATASGNIVFSVAGNAGSGNTNNQLTDHIYTNEVTLTPAASTPPPSVPSNGLVDGAGFGVKISGGGIGSVFGSNLAASTVSATTLPLTTSLGGTSVSMNSIPCPLFFVSSGQINFQVPWQLLSLASATLTVTTAGGISSPITVTLSSASPGIFTVNPAGQGAVQIANSTTFVAPVNSIPGVVSRPAVAGDFITVYCSGLGQVTNTPANGAAASGSPLSTVSGVTVTLGSGTPIPAAFAGLSPGFVGLFQVNIQIPSGLGKNDALPIVVTAANLQSNSATIAVQ